MSKTIILPSGGSITIRDFETLRGRDRAAVETAIHEADNKTPAADMITAVTKVAESLIEAWTLPYLTDEPAPGADPLGDLSPADWKVAYQALRPAVDILYPPDATPDDSDKPGSPTKPDGD